MLNFGGKRNFHKTHTHTLLTVGVEVFATARIKVWYETDS